METYSTSTISQALDLDEDLAWLRRDADKCEREPTYETAIQVCLATRNAFFSTYSCWLWGDSAISTDRARVFKEGLASALRAVRLVENSVGSNREHWRVRFFAENIRFRIKAAQIMFDPDRPYELRRASLSKLLAVNVAKVA